jgi:phosphatidylglycerophosphate synthase
MADYQPTSRRPIADLFRLTAQGAVRLCVRLGIHPDGVSYASMVAAAAAGACFWQSGDHLWLVIPAAFFCYVRLWMNMLDGMVALASGKASLRGEILNDLPDRVSDVLIFAGAAHSGLCHITSGYWAAIFALLVAYVGVFGQAVGAGRQFGGVMSKPWRMVALHIGSWIAAAHAWSEGVVQHYGGLTILDWTHAVIIAGCVQSIWVRLATIMRYLQQKEANK